MRLDAATGACVLTSKTASVSFLLVLWLPMTFPILTMADRHTEEPVANIFIR